MTRICDNISVKRKFEAFNARIINSELRALPFGDASKLMHAMENFQAEFLSGFVVKNYGGGLLMIKSTNQGSGRGLFFYSRIVNGVQICMLVLVYKKESQEVPANVLALARKRVEESR